MLIVLLYLVLEIATIVAIASWIGVLPTLLLLIAGGVVGGWLARREGVRAITSFAAAARDGRVAHQEMTDGLLVAVGGLLILLPGFLSDVAGLALLLPPTRALLRTRLVNAAERRAPTLRSARIRGAGPVVDGEVVDPQWPGAPSQGSTAPQLPPPA